MPSPPVTVPSALDELRQAIRFVPVPSRRPGFSRADELSGLTLLEVALRLDHVTRASEHLSLFDSGHLRRTVSVDLDLRRLSARQHRALAVRERTRTGAAPASRPPSRSPNGDAPSQIWVPLARQSRFHQAPVTITDASGSVVPRLTTHATERVLIAGMARLLRLQVGSRAAAGTQRPEQVLRVRARWLIERGMAHLIRHGYGVTVTGIAQPPAHASDEARDVRRFRREAERYLDGLTDVHRQELEWLLTVAAQGNLLIAMVPATPALTHLTYQAPLIPAEPRPLSIRGSLRRWLWTGRDLTVTYDTQIPRIVRSYHLSVEVPEEIHVRRFLLVTDADRVAVENLIHDLRQLARAADRFKGVGGAVYRGELHDALARCAALARLRTADLVHYRHYLHREFQQFGDSLPEPPAPALDAAGLVADLCTGTCTFWHLPALAFHHERGDLLRLGDEPPERLQTALTTLAGYLHDADLVHDLSLDNDPRENGSHAYWANVELPFGPRPAEPVNAQVHLDLADEPPALIGSVTRMVAALLGVVVLLDGLLLATSARRLDQADAAVAVLLLVPGILLSRLDIPGTHSVLGRLRAYPRRIAYLSVGITTVLAVAVAVDSEGLPPVFHAAAGALAVLLAVCGAQIAAHAVNRRALAPDSALVPRWLTQAMGVPDRPGCERADLHFDAVLVNGTAETGSGRRFNQLFHLQQRVVERLAAQRRRRRSRSAAALNPPVDEPGPVHPAHPIETVTTNARTAGERATGIAFLVTHRYIARPGDEVSGAFSPADAAPDASPESALGAVLGGRRHRDAASAFGITAYGTTCEVTTALDTDPTVLEAPEFITSRLEPGGAPGWSSIRATARVSSHYPVALRNVNEILVQLGTVPDLGLHQSLMLGHVLAELTALASRRGARPVSVISPVAPPAAVTARSTEQAGLSVGPYLRIWMSNSREHGDARIAFEADACKLARRLGLGLYLSAGRAGFGTRTWTPVVKFRRTKYRQARSNLFGRVPDTCAGEQVLLTLVGPSPSAPASGTSAGSDLAVLTAILRRLGIGVHATSVWEEHRTSFVHLLMPRQATETALSLDDVYDDPIRFLVEQCGTAADAVRAGAALAWPPGYTVVLANVAPLSRRRETRDWIVPFWIAWDLPAAATSIDHLTQHLVSAFRRMGRPAWLTYVRARCTDDDRWRGRAKVSADVPPEWIREQRTAELGGVAKRVQELVIATMVDELGLPAHTVNVHVAWGERWLGRPVDW